MVTRLTGTYVVWWMRHNTRLPLWWRHKMAFCAGNPPVTGAFPSQRPMPPVTVVSPNKGQWRGALKFSLICAWANGWANNRHASDLRRYRGHYDAIAMTELFRCGSRRVPNDLGQRVTCSSMHVSPGDCNIEEWKYLFHHIHGKSTHIVRVKSSPRNFTGLFYNLK